MHTYDENYAGKDKYMQRFITRGGHSYMMYDMQIYAFKYLQEKGVKIEAMHG